MALDPKTTAFLFPGQGSQALGMGKDVAAAHPAAAEVFAEADDILGYSLSKLCWEGPVEKLNVTLHTQPALLTHSIAVLRAFEDHQGDFKPGYAAGHSLGEFSALVAAGSLSFPDALSLVQERGQAMKSAGVKNPGGMAAVLGLQIEQVEEACTKASESAKDGVWVANDNCSGQIVISGHEPALKRAEEVLFSMGARKVVRLAVSIPAHTPLMKHAQDHFNLALETTAISDPGLSVIGNVSAKPLKTSGMVRDDLTAQLTVRVRWTQSIQSMLEAGVTTFLEIGSGSVLVGLLRRIDRSAAGYALDEPASFAIPNATQ